MVRSYEGREACCAWRHYSNQNVVALADNIALKQPCSEANQRHKAGNFLTLRKESDLKKQAVKLLELKIKVVRELITEWKEKEVEPAHQSNSQGSADADVPADEGQAKEGA